MPNTKPTTHRTLSSRLAHAGRVSLCLASLVYFSGCQSQPPKPNPPTALPIATPIAVPQAADGLQTEKGLQNRIVAEIGTAACVSNAQCRTLALGARACGGPQAWLAWSSVASNEGTLRTLSEQLTAMQKRRHAQSGMASTCQYIADPGALCSAQQCVLRTLNAAQ